MELCHSTGCELAGELLRFESIYLNYFGALGALLMAILGFISIKKESFEKLFLSVVFASVTFETIMIAYQVIANPEPCIFCMGVYIQLLFIAFMSDKRYLLFCMPAIVAIYVSMASLAIPANKSIITGDGLYLLHSETCPHCNMVKKYLASKSMDYTGISIIDPNGRSLLKSLGYTQIPVLIIKKGSHIETMKGDKDIIAYLSKKDINQTASATENSSSDSDIKLDNNEDGGCEASIFKAPSCEDKSVLGQ